MFLINGEPLTQRSYPEHFEWLKNKQREVLDSGKKEYVFRAFRDQAKIELENGQLKKVPQTRQVTMQADFTGEDGVVGGTWNYVTSLSACKPLGDGRYSPNHRTMNITGEQVFKVPQDLEIIVFLLYMSKNKHIILLDPEKENKEKVQKAALEGDAHWYIFSNESPLSVKKNGTEDVLRNIAMAWRVAGADVKDISTVQIELWNAVQQSQVLINATGRGYEVFCKEAARLGDVDKRTNVLLAIDRGIVYYEDNRWMLKAKGGTEQMLCGVPLGKEAQKDERVIKYILDDDDVYDMVRVSIEKGADPLTQASKKLSYSELLEGAKSLGWKDANKKKKEVLEEIIEKGLTPQDA